MLKILILFLNFSPSFAFIDENFFTKKNSDNFPTTKISERATASL